jgi:hypothetical protein
MSIRFRSSGDNNDPNAHMAWLSGLFQGPFEFFITLLAVYLPTGKVNTGPVRDGKGRPKSSRVSCSISATVALLC